MGKRGPKKTPTKTLKIRGSWRADVRKDEPTPNIAIPAMPDWLSGEAKKEWNRVCLLLYNEGILTKLDKTSLALYCQAYVDYIEALKYCQKLGLLAKTKKGNVIQNPAVGIKNKAFQALMKISAEFGMSPSSRTNIVAHKTPASKQKQKTIPFKVA